MRLRESTENVKEAPLIENPKKLKNVTNMSTKISIWKKEW